MPYMRFSLSPLGFLVPKHCGESTLTFGIRTSFCAECGANFDTVEVTKAGMLASGKKPDELQALFATLLIGKTFNSPMHGKDTPNARIAEKLAREAIAKAGAK